MALKLIEPGKRRNKHWVVRGTLIVWDTNGRHTISVDRSTGTLIREEAEAAKAWIEAEARIQTTTGKAREKTFGQAAAAYLTAGGDHRFLEPLVDAFEHWALSAIDQEAVDREGRKAYPDVAPSTLRRQWHGPLIAVLRHVGHMPAIRRPRGGQTRTHFLRPATANALISNVARGRYRSPWAAALVTTLIGQGPRVGEALAIDGRDDVFLDYGYIVLRDTKNDRERVLPLRPRVKAALSLLPNLGEPGPLFRRPDGEPYTPRDNRGGQIRTMFATSVRAIGLDPSIVTPHLCRHTWATWHYAETRDVLRVRDAGGWASTATLERYVKLATPALAEDIRTHGWGLTSQGGMGASGTMPEGLRHSQRTGL